MNGMSSPIDEAQFTFERAVILLFGPAVRKREDLNQVVRTHLISNATGQFRYHTDPRQRIRFGRQGQHVYILKDGERS